MAHSLSIRVSNMADGATLSASRRGLIASALDLCVAEILITATRLVTGIRAVWKGCVPGDRLRIYYANHTSHVDFLLLWSALPRSVRHKTRPVAARDYWQQNWLRRYFAEHVFHCVFIDRERSEPWLNPVEPLLQALGRGESLIVFPEGTRGDGEVVQSFRTGIFYVATERPEVELVPVWLDNAHRVMPKGGFLPLPILCASTFGRPVRLQHNEEKSEFLERLREELIAVREHGVAT